MKVSILYQSISRFSTVTTDYQIAEQLNLELDYSDETGDYRKTNFPARHIYERVLPAIVEKHSDIYYHRGSPYSGHCKPTTDQTLGDLHQCEFENEGALQLLIQHLYIGNVWHGKQQSWHDWDILSGRFVSEFGMQVLDWSSCPVHTLNFRYREGYPNIRTVDYWLSGDISERYPQSRSVNYCICSADAYDRLFPSVNSNHNKASGFERRLEVIYLTP